MKNLMLFGYDDYYPCGGINDFIGFYSSVEEVQQYLSELKYKCDEYEVFDISKNEVIYSTRF